MQIDFASRAVASANELTIFEISPLVHQLAKLLAAARLLTAADFLREGGQGAEPVFNAGAIQQAFVKMVKTERQPEKLGSRILTGKKRFGKQAGSRCLGGDLTGGLVGLAGFTCRRRLLAYWQCGAGNVAGVRCVAVTVASARRQGGRQATCSACKRTVTL